MTEPSKELDEIRTKFWEQMTSENTLRKQILQEFKQVLKLAPADYTENCTNVVMSIISDLMHTVIMVDGEKPYEAIAKEVIGEDDIKKPNDDDYDDYRVCETCDVILDDMTEPEYACICDRRNQLRDEQRKALDKMFGVSDE